MDVFEKLYREIATQGLFFLVVFTIWTVLLIYIFLVLRQIRDKLK